MNKKQKKIALIIEIIYSLVWLAVIVATGLIGSAGIGLAMIALDAIAILYGGWLFLFYSATDKVTTITLLAVMIGNVVSAIVMNW